MIINRHIAVWIFWSVVTVGVAAQTSSAATSLGELRLRVNPLHSIQHRTVPAVVWLEPAAGTPPLEFSPHGHYSLLQKNRMFTPHLQVIPVGAAVQFPNADPFFHNVFSLYDGKRFDLGLYEAGSSRSVTFSREGISYIFCNIHPEMSAVVLALSTPLYVIADTNNSFVLRNIPAGRYTMHLWIEGVSQPLLDSMSHLVQITSGALDLGSIAIPTMPAGTVSHTNKFGNVYDQNPKSPYDR